MPRTVKVAVIGSGLAGLTAAYMLTNKQPTDVEFEVHLFEKTSTLGMDSSAISLPIPGTEQTWRVDVPMRSFQGGYYKRLMALYRKLGVSFVERDFTYSFSQLSRSSNSHSISTDMIYNGSSGLKGVSMPSKMSDWSKVRPRILRTAASAWATALFAFWSIHLLCCYLRLLCLSLPWTRPSGIHTMTYTTWVSRTAPKGYIARYTGFDRAWSNFTTKILVPLFSAVCTAPEDEILHHPVEEMLDYIWLTLGTHHYVVQNGVRDVVSKLTKNVANIHLGAHISSIHPDEVNPDLVSVHHSTAGGLEKIHSGFHHVVFATQANRCIPLLTSYADSLPPDRSIHRQAVKAQIACLEKFTYSATIVINHTDETLLPDDSRDHRELNLIYTSESASSSSYTAKNMRTARSLPASYTMTTQILPRPAKFPPHLPAVFQTTNPTLPLREGRILSVASLERAVLNLDAKEALKGLYRRVGKIWREDRLGPLQGAGRGGGPGIWMCGSYAYSGIPLLEGCVVSARLVVEQGIWKREGVAMREEP